MRRGSIPLLALILAFALASCGGDDSTEVTTRQAPATDAPRETGEQSVESFGAEAEAADRDEIVTAEQAYLEALASEDYAAACGLLGRQAQASIEQLAGPKASGCQEILPKLLAASAATTARVQANGEITKVRVEGDQAFVIFRAPGAKLYVFTMAREGNKWKATATSASILVPDPAMLE
jgi:hypothetical protein